jgi:dihydroneopterin aldolase
MNSIFIEGLDLPVHIGVPDQERALPQVLRANLTLHPALSFEQMKDEIAATIDYQAVANRLRALASERPRKLIETLAHEMAEVVLKEFGAVWVRIELRKRILPGTDAVGVCVEHST